MQLGWSKEALLAAYPDADCFPDPETEPADQIDLCEIPPVGDGRTKVLNASIVRGSLSNAWIADLATEHFQKIEDMFTAHYGPPTRSADGETEWNLPDARLRFSRVSAVLSFNPLPDSVANVPQPAQPSIHGDCTPPKIKGLCVGMSMSEAVARVDELYGEKVLTALAGSVDAPKSVFVGGGVSLLSSEHAVQLVGQDGKLLMFSFSGPAVSKLFNAGDMAAQEFAQAILNSYGLPEFPAPKVHQQEVLRGQIATIIKWEYADPESGINVSVVASDEVAFKSLSVVQGTPASDRTFD